VYRIQVSTTLFAQNVRNELCKCRQLMNRLVYYFVVHTFVAFKVLYAFISKYITKHIRELIYNTPEKNGFLFGTAYI
jgi:hypothetical protein